MVTRVNEAVSFIRCGYNETPVAGIVLGSGLGNLTSELKIDKEIPYADIPHFPISTVEGHSGKLVLGELGGKKVVAMAGRFHYYEGYRTEDIIFPIRVMKFLGIRALLISNAAGAVNPEFKVGDLMIITDHISQFTPNPLIGKNEEAFGPRFPDMSEPYSKLMIGKAKRIAQAKGLEIKEGVYVSVTGPTFETRAEYKMIRAIGGDVVGMSTVQEVIAAVHMGLPCFAISVVTDIGLPEENIVITHEEVLKAAKDAEPKLTYLFKELLAAI
jgi:purine-nucleoside phosphorylase